MLPAMFIRHSILAWVDKKIIIRLPNWALWGILLTLAANLAIIDVVPFVDEISLAFLSWRAMAEVVRRRTARRQLEAGHREVVDS